MASIYLKGNVWWVQYYRNGKRHQESLGTTNKKAAFYLRAKKEASLVETSHLIPSGSANIQDCLERFNSEAINLRSKTTIENDRIRLNKFFSYFNCNQLSDVSEEMVINYLKHRMQGKSSINHVSANHYIVTFKKFFNWCIKRNLITINPLSKIKKYRVEKSPKRFLTKGEIEAILTASQNETLFEMIATAIYTGMRKSELLRLRWQDIDFKESIILVQKSKSGKFRKIPLHERLNGILRVKRGDPAQTCFSFVNNRRVFGRIVRKAKTYGIGWHTFRHTFASQLVQAGVDIYKVSKYLGHSTIATTEIYAHLQPNNDKDINRL